MEEELLSKIGVTKNRGFGVVRIAGYSSVVRSAIIPALGDLSKSDFKGQYEVLCKEVRELPPLLFSGAVDYIVTLEKVPRSDVEELVLGEEELVEIRPLKIKTEVYLDHEVDDTTTLDFLPGKAALILSSKGPMWMMSMVLLTELKMDSEMVLCRNTW